MDKKKATHTADPLLTTQQLADYLQRPIGTLYQWRHRGLGPVGIRIGRELRFRQSEIEAWLDSLTEDVA